MRPTWVGHLGFFALALAVSTALFSRELAPRAREPRSRPALNAPLGPPPPQPKPRSEPKHEPIFATEPPEPEPT
jgi:hypothetical protein